MKRLKKLAKYSVFEQEIRDPGPALKKVLKNIISANDNNERDFWKYTEKINNAIEQDISMSKNDILDYFECYSDFYKDVNGCRPRYDYVNWYLSVLCYAVADNNLTTNYNDYSGLESEFELQDEDLDEQVDKIVNERVDGTTLNGEPLDANMVDIYNSIETQREYDEFMDSLKEDEENTEDEFDRLPKRSPNRKKF